ncbi:MAG: phosphohydrolase [Ruminococcaceae bacterium]|nr:phosphohydrolase [Oscillospiraceae bacterium]
MSMTTATYRLSTSKLQTPVRIVFISDLHNSLFGKNQSELIAEVEKADPDIVVIGGDIADKTQDYYPENSYILAEYLGKRYPCYYSMGNHEYSRGDSSLIKQRLQNYGIKVLQGSGEVLTVNNEEIEVCGIFDANAYFEKDGEYVNELQAVTAEEGTDRYRVLIAHFPEDVEEYLKGNFDLILSGHAHGGQWRIPGILNGLYAPGQGFFPKYAGGLYQHGDTWQIVSRGLWKPSTVIAIPRVFNRPEFVIADIVPEGQK